MPDARLSKTVRQCYPPTALAVGQLRILVYLLAVCLCTGLLCLDLPRLCVSAVEIVECVRINKNLSTPLTWAVPSFLHRRLASQRSLPSHTRAYTVELMQEHHPRPVACPLPI